MRLQKVIALIEDQRDVIEFENVDKDYILELNEALEVLRNYAGDTTENGLPCYVAFMWAGNREKMGRYTKPQLRRFQAASLMAKEMAEKNFTHGYIISSVRELEELVSIWGDKTLALSAEHFLNWQKKIGSIPFRYKKEW